MDNAKMTKRQSPLTDAQLGIYLACIDTSNNSDYLIPLTFYFDKGNIDAVKLAEAFNKVAECYTAFSTVVSAVNGEPIMSVTDVKLPKVAKIDVSEEDAKKHIVDLFRGFAFDGGLLWRCEILETPAQVILAAVFHHIIFDGSSIGVFNKALADAYAGKPLSEDGTDFDFKAAEVAMLASDKAKSADTYFDNYLGGLENDSNIMPDKASDGKYMPVTAIYDFAQTEAQIKAFASENKVTENIVFLSAFTYALSKFNNQSETVFASVESGRYGGGYDNSIGMFVKSFPLRFAIDEQMPSGDFVKYIKGNYIDTLCHNHTQYTKIIKEYPGVADVEFIYQGEILKPYPVADSVPHLNVLETYEPISNLNALVCKQDGGYFAWIGYNGGLYTPEMIDCFADLYKTVLGEIISGKKLCDFELVSKKSREFINASNSTGVDNDLSLTIGEMFVNTAEKYSDRTAVSYCGKKMSYAELLTSARKLAHYITQKGLGKDDFIPILIPRNEYMAVCTFGVILAGAAYQPLDPAYPEERLQFMVSDSHARLLVADRALVKSVGDFNGDILFTDEIDSLPVFDGTLPESNPHDAALLIYTSGTTGLPKGCIIEQKNIIALYYCHKKCVELSEKSKVATIASYGFDAGAMDICTTVLAGAELCIIPDEIKLDLPQVEGFYIQNGITNGFMTTQLGRMFLEQTSCRTLKHFVLGGEKLVPFTPPEWVVCHNDYGPSEAIAYICGFVIKDNSLIQPIGKPSDNVRLYIVDGKNRLLPPGACGELCIAGPQVSRGYLNRPEKTAEVFVANPFCTDAEYDRIYKTGDIVRMLPDGNYDFIGRRDGQVKIRGFRIELTEIEQVIRAYDGIKNATVQAYDDAGSGKYVAAFIVSDETVDIDALNDFILGQKPPYMVPAVTMQIDAIPVNANGKVDRKKLPKPERRYAEVVKPENQLQQDIFDTVASVVGTDAFGIDTDFYMAGLSSIGSIKLCTRLAEKFGISVQIKNIRQNNTVRKLEAFIHSTDCGQTAKHAAADDYPLTKTQEGILVECISKPESTFYNIPLLLKISSELDAKKLKSAIAKTVNNHPYLETELFTNGDGVIRQRRKAHPDFTEEDIETVAVNSFDEIKASAVKPFELMESRLFRWRIYTGKDNYLFFEIHHIIADGTGINILIDEIQRVYAGETPSGEMYDSYDLALDEAEKRSSPMLVEAKAYYQTLLDGLDMNFLPGPDRLSVYAKSNGTFIMSERYAAVAKAEEYCAANNISLNGLLCSAFGFTLAKYAGTEYSVFNTVYNGRNDSRSALTIGMLVKTLPVVCNIEQTSTAEIAKNITGQLIDSMSNDLYSFAEISKEFGVKNDIIFIFQGDSFNFDSFCGKQSQKIELELSESKTPLSVQVVIENNRFKYIAEYDADLFTEALIKTFVCVLDKVIASFVAEQKVSDVCLLTDEIAARLDAYNNTEFAYDTSKTIADYFAYQARLHPDKTCVVYKEKSYTFEKAFDISCRVGAYLMNKGVKNGDVVAILIPRDETMIFSAHGAIMAGAAYVGLDPTYPKDRLSFMIKDSGARVLIANRSLINLIDGFDGEILYTDEFDSLPLDKDFDPTAQATPDGVALVVYSSGTTGVPKGGQICHKNVVCFYQNYTRDMDINENANVAMYASFGFDGGAMDIFCLPMAGGTLCIVPDEIRLDLEKLEQFYIQNKITTGFMTTQVGTMFIRNTHCRTLKDFVVGGEALIPTLPPEGIAFSNGYGPSETMCYVNIYRVTDTGSLQPIGKPRRNIKEYIIDKFGHRLPFGACGELCIAGGQTGLGYLNRPDKTAASFVKNPFNSTVPYDRMYRTGDIVRQLPDGNYVFEGRRDGQVKIRGFRVELTEIEQIIREFPSIKTAAVQAFDSKAGGKFIAAYIVSDDTVDIEALNGFIASRKPDYMIPAVTLQIDEIPLTSNGKVDRKKLPEPVVVTAKKGAEPANETEEALCNIFEEVLGIPKVYADDDFFHIGGSSISAIQVIVKCNNAGYDIVFKNLFTNPTPHSLSEYIHGHREDETFAPAGDEVRQYDYSALKYNKVEYVDEIVPGEIGDVFLTGSTGFLGSHILKELLDNTSSRVICLVRSKADMDAETRFRMMMTYYFEDWYSAEKSERVTIIDGELGDTDIWDKVRNIGFDTIINSAANVKHFAAGNQLLKDNFSGVENLIKLAEETKTLLVQISSTSVSGEAAEGKISDDYLFTESDLNIGQSLENKYIYSKYQAEQAVIDAVSRGRIKAKIIRLGNLMARFDDSEFQVNAGSNGFLKMFSGYKRLAAFPVDSMDKKIEFSPIDATARAVVLLSGTPDKFTVFHAKNCNKIHYGYLINAMKKEGIDLRLVSNKEFADIIDAALKEEKEVQDLSSLIAYKAGNDGRIMHQIESDATFTTKALYRLGFAWPLIDSDYLENMVKTLMALGFFE